MSPRPPRLRVSHLVRFLVSALLVVGCGGSRGADDLDAVFQVISEPSASPAQVTRALVAVLDSASRARVEAHAAGLSESLGVPVGADDVLMLGGFAPGLRVHDVATEAGAVRVVLGRIDAGPEGSAPMAEPVVWAAREEQGRMRLVLPEGVLAGPVAGGAP